MIWTLAGDSAASAFPAVTATANHNAGSKMALPNRPQARRRRANEPRIPTLLISRWPPVAGLYRNTNCDSEFPIRLGNEDVRSVLSYRLLADTPLGEACTPWRARPQPGRIEQDPDGRRQGAGPQKAGAVAVHRLRGRGTREIR